MISDDEPNLSEGETEMADEPEYRIITREDLETEMKETISDVQSVLQVDLGICRILLHKFKWNKDSLMERYYENPDTKAFLIESQVIPKVTEKIQNEGEEAECDICCDLVHLSGLACNHRACDTCWITYLTDKIKDGQSEIECMSSECKLLMEDEKILKYITNDTDIVKYHRLVINSYVETNSLLSWCPEPNCGKAVKVTNSEPQLVICSCGQKFCFSCGDESHDPVGCRHLKIWTKKAEEMKEKKQMGEGYGADSETFTWLMSNTRDCPKCFVSIEKNGGCNYMQCKNGKCKYQFCWVCMNSWSVHSQAWYKCNSYDEEADKKRETSRAEVHRFLFYYTRYINHKRSLELEQKLRLTVREKMVQMEEKKNMRWFEGRFLEHAVDVLSECRRTMMLTYIFAYFLVKDNNQLIFEGNQKDMEMATEQLSGFLENDMENEDLNTLRQKVLDKCRYVEHRRKTLLDHCTEGTEQEFWVYID